MKKDDFLVEDKIQQENTEKVIKLKKRTRIWILVASGLFAMFFFVFVMLGLVYLVCFNCNKTGFEILLKGAPVRSDILIDGSNWGISSEDGTTSLRQLKAGTKTIEIKNQNFNCESQEIKGNDGDSISMIARCVPIIKSTVVPQKSVTPRIYDKSDDCIYNGKCKTPVLPSNRQTNPPNIQTKPFTADCIHNGKC